MGSARLSNSQQQRPTLQAPQTALATNCTSAGADRSADRQPEGPQHKTSQPPLQLRHWRQQQQRQRLDLRRTAVPPTLPFGDLSGHRGLPGCRKVLVQSTRGPVQRQSFRQAARPQQVRRGQSKARIAKVLAIGSAQAGQELGCMCGDDLSVPWPLSSTRAPPRLRARLYMACVAALAGTAKGQGDYEQDEVWDAGFAHLFVFMFGLAITTVLATVGGIYIAGLCLRSCMRSCSPTFRDPPPPPRRHARTPTVRDAFVQCDLAAEACERPEGRGGPMGVAFPTAPGWRASRLGSAVVGATTDCSAAQLPALVFLSPYGECYHTDAGCEGLAKSRREPSALRVCTFCKRPRGRGVGGG